MELGMLWEYSRLVLAIVPDARVQCRGHVLCGASPGALDDRDLSQSGDGAEEAIHNVGHCGGQGGRRGGSEGGSGGGSESGSAGGRGEAAAGQGDAWACC